ncbi:MAG: DNA cytosine methyltransferase, partial [Cyanobacteria bacterium]|nr:DNA cytosine methyltransferase [Cyanobacteriota bacterium]
NENANIAFAHNFALQPIRKNLEQISCNDIPQSDLWWMSPPCTPYSRRGKGLDTEDPRARALLNLIELLPSCLPQFVMLENVREFSTSKSYELLQEKLQSLDYKIESHSLCSTDFGVPMRRPRFFLIACRNKQVSPIDLRSFSDSRTLPDYLDSGLDDQLLLDEEIAIRYAPVINAVEAEDPNATLICFTRGYDRCRKASGSLLKLSSGRLRLFAPDEILRLFGFSDRYELPLQLSLAAKLRLVGNSVDVRAVKALLGRIL